MSKPKTKRRKILSQRIKRAVSIGIQERDCQPIGVMLDTGTSVVSYERETTEQFMYDLLDLLLCASAKKGANEPIPQQYQDAWDSIFAK